MSPGFGTRDPIENKRGSWYPPLGWAGGFGQGRVAVWSEGRPIVWGRKFHPSHVASSLGCIAGTYWVASQVELVGARPGPTQWDPFWAGHVAGEILGQACSRCRLVGE